MLTILQVSHHPPISAYIVEGPSGSWRFSGWSQPAVTPVVKYYGIKTMATGERRLELADGTRIDMYAPYFAIKGEERAGGCPLALIMLGACCAVMLHSLSLNEMDLKVTL